MRVLVGGRGRLGGLRLTGRRLTDAACAAGGSGWPFSAALALAMTCEPAVRWAKSSVSVLASAGCIACRMAASLRSFIAAAMGTRTASAMTVMAAAAFFGSMSS